MHGNPTINAINEVRDAVLAMAAKLPDREERIEIAVIAAVAAVMARDAFVGSHEETLTEDFAAVETLAETLAEEP